MKVSEKVYELIKEGYLRNVSDLHFQPNETVVKVFYRANNKIFQVDEVDVDFYQKILRYVKFKSKVDISEKKYHRMVLLI